MSSTFFFFLLLSYLPVFIMLEIPILCCFPFLRKTFWLFYVRSILGRPDSWSCTSVPKKNNPVHSVKKHRQPIPNSSDLFNTAVFSVTEILNSAKCKTINRPYSQPTIVKFVTRVILIRNSKYTSEFKLDLRNFLLVCWSKITSQISLTLTTKSGP